MLAREVEVVAQMDSADFAKSLLTALSRATAHPTGVGFAAPPCWDRLEHEVGGVADLVFHYYSCYR